MKSKGYYKHLDFIRLLSCITVFLYHLNILKGGFLAVCTFFVLTGYLSFVSSFNKKEFSIKEYYLGRLKGIYLPLLLVTFISIFVISLIPSIDWINLKPETTSVVFGYNNFWQLSASLDYFARHVASPFMHFWYISILLQFELVFPIIFIGIKKFNEKFNKIIPCIVLILLSLLSTTFFIYSSFNQNIMSAYYNTFTRAFSILFGLTLGYINCYYKKLISDKMMNTYFRNVVVGLYIVLLCTLFVVVDSTSNLFVVFMILTSIISCRLIEYTTIEKSADLNIFDKLIKYSSSISYEIYLIQYPVIFLFQECGLTNNYSFLLIILITIVLSLILHFSLSINKEKNNYLILKVITLTLLSIFSIFGFIKYLISKDYTEELKELESQLNANQELMEQRQKEYALKLEEEEKDWELTLENLGNDEANLNETVKNLHVIGIGDSVMLGAIKSLYAVFPNGYFDAKTSRTDWEANGILQRLKNRGMLGDPIIFGLGTNGQCGAKCRTKIFSTVGDRKMFWITTTNKKMAHINDQLKELSKSKNNVYIIDWVEASKGHGEYFLADKIHLTAVGKDAYSKYIFDEIYNVYLEEIKSKKDKMIEEHNEKEKLKVSFYGNDLLLNSFEFINDYFKDSRFAINNYDYESLYLKLKEDINSNYLGNKYVFVFNSDFKMTESEYKRLIDLLDDKEIYVLFMNSKYNLKYKNVNVINFNELLEENKEYLLIDRIHLSNDGSLALANKIKEEIK